MEKTSQPLVIFVSSSIAEFSQERAAIKKAIAKIGIARTWLFEDSPASAEPAQETYLKAVERADLFILLLGERLPDPVRLEYESARALSKPTLVFIKDVPTRDERLQEFIRQISSQLFYATFKSSNDLTNKVSIAVTRLIIDGSRRFSITTSDVTEPRYKREIEVREKRAKRDKKFCFVIMPIGKQGARDHKEFKAIFESLIKPAVEIDDRGKPTGLRCERADQEIRTGNIPKDIIEKLAAAEIVVADLTTRNPNVFYELGVRHSFSP